MGAWRLQDTIVAVRKGGEKLVISNLEDSTYATQTFDTDPNQVRQSFKGTLRLYKAL